MKIDEYIPGEPHPDFPGGDSTKAGYIPAFGDQPGAPEAVQRKIEEDSGH